VQYADEIMIDKMVVGVVGWMKVAPHLERIE
jgi:hypothetical protein